MKKKPHDFAVTRKDVFYYLLEKYPKEFVNVVKEGLHVVLHLRGNNEKVYACATHTRGYSNRTMDGWADMVRLKLSEINHVRGN